MPKFFYDNEGETPEVRPTVSEDLPTVSEEGETVQGGEEFDISSFDFTISDPGEILEFSQTEEGKAADQAVTASDTTKRFSLSNLSAALSETAERLMAETPREPKPCTSKPKSPKPPRERKPLFLKKERETAVDLPQEEAPAPAKEKIHFTGGTFSQVSRRWLRYALRPSGLYDGVTELLYPLFLVGVMLFFGGFYLLLGLDWYFAELISVGRLFAIAAVGLLVGGAAAMSFGGGVQGLSLLCRKERINPFRVLGTVAGACVYPASLLILGLLIQLIFKASVSMSFGVTAILWLLCSLLDVLRDLMGEKHLFKCVVFTVLWGFLLFLTMSLTFTLK